MRTNKQHDLLCKVLSRISFFKDQKIKASDQKEIADLLTLEKVKRNEIVFDYGVPGDKFYMILNGEVEVLLPNTDEIPDWKEKYALYQQVLKERKVLEDLRIASKE